MHKEIMRLITLFLVLVFCDAYAQLDTVFTPIYIPVRTGDSLAADFYSLDSTQTKPVILIQTPYNKDAYRLMSLYMDLNDTTGLWNLVHYNFVILDWRGFYSSMDAGSVGYDRGLDGYDAIEWIASCAWCDGNIGTYGASALGAIQFMTAKHCPPHLVCCLPLVKDFRYNYFDYYYGGVLLKEHTEAHERLGFTSMDLIISHPTLDWFWIAAEMLSEYPESIGVPVLMIAGWYDHFPRDVIYDFHLLKNEGVPSVREQHKLIMGPWCHSSVGMLVQGELEYPAAAGIDDDAAKELFDHYLRGASNGYEFEPTVRYFQMGIDEWRTADDWYEIPAEYDTLYFYPDSALSWDFPMEFGCIDSFLYNPKYPSPAYGGPRFDPWDLGLKIGPWDERDSVESRDDVLIFTTPELIDDIEIVGQVKVLLYVSSDKLDTDFIVRLCDVYPDGRSIILNYGARRMRFRDAYEYESLITPGEIYSIEIEMQDIAMTFLAGNKLRIVVGSSCYPYFDANLNNGGEMYVEGDTLIALNKVNFDSAYPSAVILPVCIDTTAVMNDDAMKPKSFSIRAFPNPFNSSCKIKINIADDDYHWLSKETQVEIYDLRGRIVHTGNVAAGSKPAQMEHRADLESDIINRTFVWTPDKTITSGIYSVRVRTENGGEMIKRVVYLK